MDNEDNKMERALAEILGVRADIVDVLGLTIENDIGNDDCSYGYYVEFPKKSDIDTSILLTLEQVKYLGEKQNLIQKVNLLIQVWIHLVIKQNGKVNIITYLLLYPRSIL